MLLFFWMSVFFCCFQWLLYLNSEALILFLSFVMVFYYLFDKVNLGLYRSEGDVSFTNDVDWKLLMNFFIKVRCWFRFYKRYVIYKYNAYYKFLIACIEYLYITIKKNHEEMMRIWHKRFTLNMLNRLKFFEYSQSLKRSSGFTYICL